MIKMEITLTPEQVMDAIKRYLRREIIDGIILDSMDLTTYGDSKITTHIGDEIMHEHGWKEE